MKPEDDADVIALVRALLLAARLPVSDSEIEEIARGYPAQKASIESWYELDAASDEAPALSFDPKPKSAKGFGRAYPPPTKRPRIA